MKYGKAIASIGYAGLTAAYAIVHGGGTIDPAGWVQIGIAVATAASVYLVPLTPEYPWAKSATAAVLAALQVLATAVVGGLQVDELLMVVLAVLGALGVYIAPAGSGTDGTDSGEPSIQVGLGADIAL